MNAYLWIKLVHIISATILFGTGLGIAFFMLRAHLSGSREAMTIVVLSVVMADWVFLPRPSSFNFSRVCG